MYALPRIHYIRIYISYHDHLYDSEPAVDAVSIVAADY